jgi:hypothetical protein
MHRHIDREANRGEGAGPTAQTSEGLTQQKGRIQGGGRRLVDRLKVKTGRTTVRGKISRSEEMAGAGGRMIKRPVQSRRRNRKKRRMVKRGEG